MDKLTTTRHILTKNHPSSDKQSGSNLVMSVSSQIGIYSGAIASIPDASNIQAFMLAFESELLTLMTHHGLAMRNEEEEATKLNNVANMLISQYEQSGSIEILNEAICLIRQTLLLYPNNHPSYTGSLIDLAKAIILRYQETGDRAALADCISLSRKALALCPPGHTHRGKALRSLATGLSEHYGHSGDTAALTECIGLNRNALALWPEGHPHRGEVLNSLAVALVLRYEHSGDMATLAECINLNRNALALRPQGHIQRAMSLNNLANALTIYHQQNGDMDILAECVKLHRDALKLCPEGHPRRGIPLNNSANSLKLYYDQSGDVTALAECIRLHRDALELRPQGHPSHGSSLINLADALWMHHKESGDVAALTECINLNRNTLALQPPGHPHHALSLKSLALSLRLYYKQSGDKEALVECIRLHRSTLEIWQEGHPYYGVSLYGLSQAYSQQFDLTGDEQTLLNALKCAQKILDILRPEHPLYHRAYHLIARIRLKDSSHHGLEEALDCLSLAITYTHALPRHRLKDTVKTLRSVEQASIHHLEEPYQTQRILDLYLSAVELLPLVANCGLTNTVRLRELSSSGELGRPAALRAINCNQLCLAVQLHEEGKAVFWSQALRLRSSALDALPPNDRETLRSLFNQLEHDSVGFFGELCDRAEWVRRAEHRQQLSKQAEKLIEGIRQRPGFDRFLKIPMFEQLRHAASSGYVIVLVSNKVNCFAIMIQADKPPHSIALDAIKGNGLRSLWDDMSESGMRDCDQGFSSSDVQEESIRAMSVKGHRTHNPLAKMWHGIVQPVIKSLGLRKAEGRARPRVHWCPSGELALLPLHAAGINQSKAMMPVCAADYIVSSYTPSLSTLLKARKGFAPIPRSELHAALYADSGGHSGSAVISKVFEEVQIAARILTSCSVVVDNDGHIPSTAASILEGAAKTHILHLSCHGMQHENPLESCFMVKDRPLTISDLMGLDLKNAALAYLSACYTARGDKNQPDQAVHLAASMLFCGFRSVVATMWAMHDIDGPKMAEWFYEALLKNEIITLDDVPYALDVAVTELRKEGAPARQWATYMHLGA